MCKGEEFSSPCVPLAPLLCWGYRLLHAMTSASKSVLGTQTSGLMPVQNALDSPAITFFFPNTKNKYSKASYIGDVITDLDVSPNQLISCLTHPFV